MRRRASSICCNSRLIHRTRIIVASPATTSSATPSSVTHHPVNGSTGMTIPCNRPSRLRRPVCRSLRKVVLTASEISEECGVWRFSVAVITPESGLPSRSPASLSSLWMLYSLAIAESPFCSPPGAGTAGIVMATLATGRQPRRASAHTAGKKWPPLNPGRILLRICALPYRDHDPGGRA